MSATHAKGLNESTSAKSSYKKTDPSDEKIFLLVRFASSIKTRHPLSLTSITDST